jgi:hypothetical protein
VLFGLDNKIVCLFTAILINAKESMVKEDVQVMKNCANLQIVVDWPVMKPKLS